MAVDPVRDTAINVLMRVFTKGAFINVALDRALRRKPISSRGRRFLTQLVYGTVRHATLCDHVLQRLLNQPLDELPDPIRMVLRMGVFQALFCNQVTFPAMVHTSVDLAKRHGHAGMGRLANAVLRKAPQTLEAVALPSAETDLAAYIAARYSLPEWLAEEWIRLFGPEQAEALAEACNKPAAVTVRANTRHLSRDELVDRFNRAGGRAFPIPEIPEAVAVENELPPSRSKQFDDGDFYQQDPAAMLAVHLLEPQPGDRVLDMCAAPGGKTTHIAQVTDCAASTVALDLHARKTGMILDNAERLGLTGVHAVCGDGARPPFTGPFDRVLLDAPCTGYGTFRRRPELKYRLTPDSPKEFGSLQRDLLRSAARLCKSEGVIVYSVCTFSPQETQDVVDSLLEEGVVRVEEGPQWLRRWRTETGAYQTLPHPHHLDGFFLIRLRKAS